ncbi:methyl-accepting chemotaxis protein [Spirochaetota bacterium]
MKALYRNIIAKYGKSSYELKGKVRTFFFFNVTLIPILLIFIIVQNIVTKRDLFQILNIVIVGVIVIILLSIILLYFGYFNTAVTLFLLLVIIGLFFNSQGTAKTGSTGRFMSSHFAFILPIVFSTLFSTRRMLIAVSVMSLAVMGYSLTTSHLLVPGEKGVIISSTSFAMVLTFVLGLLLNRINDTAKKLRMEDHVEKEEQQMDVNRELLSSLVSLSDNLDGASKQLSVSSDSFSENLQKQSSSIEEISATIEEISAGSEKVSNRTDNQHKSMEILSSRIGELNSITKSIAGHVEDAMNRTLNITEDARTGQKFVTSMNERMEGVNSASQEMTGILSIINDISDQINLLSLNASIEAARAGEAGRGFAVVANEIGKLADQTSTSVKDIDRLIKMTENEIKGSLKMVNVTVHGIGDIIKGVENINKMIIEISNEMGKQVSSSEVVISETEKSKQISDEIRVSAEEQKTAALEIVNAVAYINEISQNNASSAEEISANSDDIANMSSEVKGKIDSFKLD